MALKIIDVPSVLFSGYGTSFGKRSYYKGIPTGGLYLLANVIAQAIRNSDLIALVWDSPTNRRDYVPEYKSTRCRDDTVRFANKLSYEYLKNASKNCFKIEGFEADDLAASIVEYNKEQNYYIELYTADYDWAHNIYSNRQELYPANSNICRVTSENFNSIFSTSKCSMVFNAITVSKILFGDSSDHVQPLNPKTLSNQDCFKAFVLFCDKNKIDYREKESFLKFINHFKKAFNNETYQELINRTEVMFPRITPEPLIIQSSQIDGKAFIKFCSVVGCKSICNKLGLSFIEDMGMEQDRVKAMYENETGIRKTYNYTLPPKESFEKVERRAFI